jgi:hypothetical protein
VGSQVSSTARLSLLLQLGEADDISSAMYSLTTNKYINGVVLHVDGGWLLEVP